MWSEEHVEVVHMFDLTTDNWPSEATASAAHRNGTLIFDFLSNSTGASFCNSTECMDLIG